MTTLEAKDSMPIRTPDMSPAEMARGPKKVGTIDEVFAALAKLAGYTPRRASEKQRLNEKWDLTIRKWFIVSHRVAVKPRQRISRSDQTVQDKWHWVQLHGTSRHEKGWLYGKADLIAFETNKAFLIVKRSKLASLVKRVVKKEYVSSPAEGNTRSIVKQATPQN